MNARLAWPLRIAAIAAMGFAFAGMPWAQTKSETETRKFELISVDGNKLVVRDGKGTRELTVPEDFRFTVDGKKLAASDLKPGMKGTATVTTKTTETPVTVTEVKEADVLRATDTSVTIRGADGVSKRFLRGEVDARNIQLFRDGKPIRIGDLKKGDKLTATVVTSAPPKVLTEKEVQVETQAEPGAAPTAAPASGAATASTPAAATPAPAGAAKPASPATPAAPASAPKPAEATGLGMGTWLLILLVIGAVLFFVMRGKKA
jgi:hypothetical protein